MYSLAQKRYMAIRDGEDEVTLTAEEVKNLHAEKRELVGLIRKYMGYSPFEIVKSHICDNWMKGSHLKLGDGDCTISMQLTEELLAEKQGWNAIIEEMIEHVPPEVVAADINCDECGEHPYECMCDFECK
jgi:hypothetical protein